MKVSTTWIITFGLVAAAALLLSLYQLLGWTGPMILLAFIFSVVLVYVIVRLFVVHIGEMEFGAVFYLNGNFSRFLYPGFGPRKNYYLINPFAERLESRITRGSQKAHATTRFRTQDGIPVDITWAVSFKVNVDNILPPIRFKLARSLPKAADKIVGGKAAQSLRHIVEQKTAEELYGVDAIKELESQVCDQLNARLELRHAETMSTNGVSPIPSRDDSGAINGLGFDPIPWRDVQIGEVKLPPKVEKALEVAHERQLQTEMAVTALQSLKEVIEKYDDKDMERLSELERLRILDENGGSLVYLMASLAQTLQQAGNGIGSKGPGKN